MDIKPTIITSKQADDHLNMIKANHADILQGMQDQSVRVSQFNQQKEMERQQKLADGRVEQQRQDTLAKEAAENDRKTKELAIKQAALAS